jgi:phosphoribosylanthranilate isomerase
MTFIKFCGMTREADVAAACEIGVDALGFVMWPKSPRYVDAARAAALIRTMPAEVLAVAVLVTPDEEAIAMARDAGVRVIQLHAGAAQPRTLERQQAGTPQWWVATALEGNVDEIAPDVPIVLDAHDPVRHGGTGRTIDWARAATVAARRRVLLAGGLTAANVSDAIRRVRPFGVDVASGIEDRPGIKNRQAMAAFFAAVREADQG